MKYKDMRVGDLVCVNVVGINFMTKVIKVTERQITVGYHRASFRKSDGKIYGKEGGYFLKSTTDFEEIENAVKQRRIPDAAPR